MLLKLLLLILEIDIARFELLRVLCEPDEILLLKPQSIQDI